MARQRAVMMIRALAVTAGCFLSSVGIVIGQETPPPMTILDPRFRPLIGTWEGRLPNVEHMLMISETAGQLDAIHGQPGRKLRPVNLSVDLVESRVRLRVQTISGNDVTLYLIRDDWLSGVFTISAGRTPGSPERK